MPGARSGFTSPFQLRTAGKRSRSVPVRGRSYSSALRSAKRIWRGFLNPNSIELPAEEMRRIGYRTIDLIVDHLASLTASSMGRKALGSDLGPLFEFEPPEQPAGFDA